MPHLPCSRAGGCDACLYVCLLVPVGPESGFEVLEDPHVVYDLEAAENVVLAVLVLFLLVAPSVFVGCAASPLLRWVGAGDVPA